MVKPARRSSIMAISFGPDWQRELWVSPYRLRFELSTSGAYLTQFIGAHDRARALARAALPSDRVMAVVAAYPKPTRKMAKWPSWARRAAFDLLDEMGVPTAPAEASWSSHTYPQHVGDPDMSPWEHRAVSVTWDQADILLWNQVAHDLSVQPEAPVLTKLVDVARGVTIHAYNDRGMDITALSPDPILELYSRFDGWLLDYDRARMADAFAPKA
jgi:hypothetical protein